MLTLALPRILLLATGGTIASEIDRDHKKLYGSATIGGLLEAGKTNDAILSVCQIAAIGSQDMNFDVWRLLHQAIANAFDNDDADAIIITHGTDTMEETAFFLDLICPRGRPIIITGAMRAANAVAADGPRNLSNAIRVAIDPSSRDRGVLVVMNDVIHTARGLRKTAVDRLDAFQSGIEGSLGKVTPEEAIFSRPASLSLHTQRYDYGARSKLPAVGILYCHADMDITLVMALLQAPIEGLIVAGVGDGNIPAAVLQALATESTLGRIIVRSSRIDAANVPRNAEVDDDVFGFVAARALSPSKSRILLQLMLASGVGSLSEIQKGFDAFR